MIRYATRATAPIDPQGMYAMYLDSPDGTTYQQIGIVPGESIPAAFERSSTPGRLSFTRES